MRMFQVECKKYTLYMYIKMYDISIASCKSFRKEQQEHYSYINGKKVIHKWKESVLNPLEVKRCSRSKEVTNYIRPFLFR